MAIPEDHLAKFHKMTDAKEIWETIKSRFGGNDESKKMHKYILKQQFESFSVSNLDGLHKGYDRFQSLLSQLEIHGAGVFTEDANQKFLRVFESDIKGSTASSSITQNVTFISFESTNSTNDVSNAYGVSTSSGHNSQKEGSSSYTDELKYSFFANQSSGPQLDHEDLKQVDEFDLEEMDLKWQVAMISMRMKKFYKKTGRRLQFDAKEPVGFDKTKVECFNCHNTRHFAREYRSKGNQESRRRDAGNTRYKAKDNGRRPRKQEEPKALVTLDGEGVDWTGHVEDEQENFALMAYSNSGSDTEVEAQLVAHQKNQLWYEEKIRFMKIDLDDKTDVLTYHKKLLAEAMSTRDKSGLGSSDVEDSPVNDRFGKVEGMHAVPPPMTGNYTSDFDYCETNSSVETLEFVPEPVVVEPKVLVLLAAIGKLLLRPQQVVIGDPKDITGTKSPNTIVDQTLDDPQKALKNKGIVDSGCSRHMTGNKAYLVEYQDYNGGPIAFRGSKGYISGKGKIKTRKLDFEDVCFMKELQHFNLFSVSQMCDKKNKVLFTDTECLVLSPDFKLPDENQVLLRVPRQNNMYSFNLENIVPTGGLACLIAKATVDESNKWHRRLGHVNFKNLNKLVKGNLVRGQKGSRENSNARTPQQNIVAERKNRTLIEDARTMLADSFLPNTFWAEVVSTTCYVLNRVLVTKPQNKTPYELITGKIPIISYIRPFGCHVTILNTIDHLSKFEEKSDEGFLVGYSLNSKAFRPITAGPKEANQSAGTQDTIDAGNSQMETEPAQKYFVLPVWSSYTSTVKSSEEKNGDVKPNGDNGLKTNEKHKDQGDQAFLEELERLKRQEKEANDAAKVFSANYTNIINTVSTSISTASPSNVFSAGGPDLNNDDQDDSQIPALEDIYDNPSDGIFTNASYDDEGAVADFTNLETTVNVSPITTSRIHSIHPTTQILRDPILAVQTRSKVHKSSRSHAFVSYIQKQRRNNHKDFQHCLFACFLSQIKPKKISKALKDESLVDAMQEELLQFKIQKVWILVDLPFGTGQLGKNRFTEIRRMKELGLKPSGSFWPLLLVWDS
ncbi:ribonuclease H-like domain-containing protein [Tanacetum coccineum]